MNPTLNGFLLVDELSKINLKVDLTDIIRAGMTVISDLSSITSENTAETKTLIVLEEAYRKPSMIEDLKLWKSLYDLQITTITTDMLITRSALLLGGVYNIDYRTINYYSILSILSGDSSSRKSVDPIDNPELTRLAKEFLDSDDVTKRRLSEAFLSSREISKLLEDKNEELKAMWDSQETLLDSITQRNLILESMYKENLRSFMDVNNFLEIHEINTAQDTVEKINLTKFEKRPSVIYLKEYQDLLFLNSFLLTIHNVFSYQLRKKVQVIRLLDSSSTTKVLSMPDYYHRVNNKFTKNEVLSNTFLFKVGGYSEMLNIIMTNPTGLDLLILVDERSSHDTVVSGRCLQLGLCRSTKVATRLRLDLGITIVNNNPETVMSWDYYPEYPTLDESDLLLFLSSRPAVQRIIELEKIYNGVKVHE